MNKKTFAVTGMHCASCETVITKAIRTIEGVQEVQVNYATEKATIEMDDRVVSLDTLNTAVTQYGYRLVSEGITKTQDTVVGATVREKEMALQKAKTEFVVPIALAIFFIMMWDIASRTLVSIPNLPFPMELLNVMALALATVVMFWIGRPFIQGVVRFARYRVANMDTLIGIGTLTAYIYSAVITLLPQVRERFQLPDYTYFDVVIVVIGFVTLGKYLEARSKAKTGEAIKKLLDLQAKTAVVRRDGKEREVSVSTVVVGDIVLVKPGSKIPVDGTIIEGATAIDESMVTGESLPIDKQVGDVVIGATINKQGHIALRATQVGADTMLSQIIRMVEEAQGSKAPIQAMADKVSSVFVPIVLVVAFLALGAWIMIGSIFIGQTLALSYGILSFVGVLVIACPCALGLATPTAIIVGVGKGAQQGILVKDATSLELLSQVDTVVLDKTGTITQGKPTVGEILSNPLFTFDEAHIIKVAARVANQSTHPLSQAVVRQAIERNLEIQNFSHFEERAGKGVVAQCDEHGQLIALGNFKLLEHIGVDTRWADSILSQRQGQAGSVLFAVHHNDVIGALIMTDAVKPEAKEVMTQLHALGLRVVMLSGDNQHTAESVAQAVGIDTVIADVLPQEKLGVIQRLQSEGRRIAMVGDGINDAPALVQANVGIAMANGTDIAIESAGVTLLHGDLRKIVQAISLSRSTLRTVKQNLFWAFIYNVVGIPIAAGLLYPLWGIILNPVFAGLAMALSSLSVVGNSLRLKTRKL